jgi:hypothetical protein
MIGVLKKITGHALAAGVVAFAMFVGPWGASHQAHAFHPEAPAGVASPARGATVG